MKVDYSGMAENLKSDLKKAIEQNKGTLKPCPFCGGEPNLNNSCYIDHHGQRLWGVFCRACGNATQGYWDKELAIDAWNTRKPVEEVVEKLEEFIPLFEDCNSKIRYERYCKPKEKKCKDTNCFACVLGESIKIIKEGMG